MATNYLKKEQLLIRKMQESGYEDFDGDRDEALDFVASRLSAFPNYANTVIREQIMHPIWKVKYEGQEYRDKVQNMDEQRHMAHDRAIAAIRSLNREFASHGLAPFADIDTENRQAVADFVGSYIAETYNRGIGKTMDDATHEKREEYDRDEPQRRLLRHAMEIETHTEGAMQYGG